MLHTRSQPSLIALAMLVAFGVANSPASAQVKEIILRKKVQQAVEEAAEAVEAAADAAESVDRLPGLRPPGSSKPAAKKNEKKSAVDLQLERYAAIQKELVRLKLKPKADPIDQKKVYLMMEHSNIGNYYNNNGYSKYFAVRVVLVNKTDKEIKLKTDEVTLKVDKEERKLLKKFKSNQLQHQGFSVGNKHYTISSLLPKPEVKVAAGQSDGFWIILEDIGGRAPKITATVKINGQPMSLDLAQYSRAQLQMTTERIGPRECVAVMTIAGELNAVNATILADEMDELAGKHVTRVVVAWTKEATKLESNLAQYIQQAAANSGTNINQNNNNNNQNRFPIFPMTIRELHLAELPKNTSIYSSGNYKARVHKKKDVAIRSAMRTAFEVLPLPELIDAIQSDDPLVRAAALEGGGDRLPAEKLPLLLKLTRDTKNVPLMRAAMIALRHYGDVPALDRLVEIATKGSGAKLEKKVEDGLRVLAVESLATSRFILAQERLLDVLQRADEEARVKIVTVLAKYPRPVWADEIFKYAQDLETPLGRAALQALSQVGHPKLLGLLKQALRHADKNVQQQAFNHLVNRGDAESDQLAMEYTLAHLQKSPPVGNMNSLLTRTKDPRAVPLLMQHLLKSKNSSSSSMISTLAKIGDERVGQFFVKNFDKFNQNNKRYVLQNLYQMDTPGWMELAGKSLMSKSSSLVSTACQGLQNDGGEEAEAYLIEGFEKSKNTSTWSYTSNALSYMGTERARAALQKAVDSGVKRKVNYARNALTNMRQRSPAYQHIYRGNYYAKQDKWDMARDSFAMAIELDKGMVEAYAGRGNAYLNLKKLKEAKADFDKAVTLDKTNSQAVTGQAIVMVMQGDVDKGIKHIEDAKPKLTKLKSSESMLAYNTACVYGRAMEQLQKSKKPDEVKAKVAECRKKALGELKLAVEKGYRDFAAMQKDPDLKPLHKLPEFKKVMVK